MPPASLVYECPYGSSQISAYLANLKMFYVILLLLVLLTYSPKEPGDINSELILRLFCLLRKLYSDTLRTHFTYQN
jgi:hypothetical protein